jgi:hypothetical protein
MTYHDYIHDSDELSDFQLLCIDVCLYLIVVLALLVVAALAVA